MPSVAIDSTNQPPGWAASPPAARSAAGGRPLRAAAAPNAAGPIPREPPAKISAPPAAGGSARGVVSQTVTPDGVVTRSSSRGGDSAFDEAINCCCA